MIPISLGLVIYYICSHNFCFEYLKMVKFKYINIIKKIVMIVNDNGTISVEAIFYY